ncbi:hypothetical protein J1N35_011696 [Gossypium stocksii]|uniref:Uncharacterized protein n=1 Tax=Gossypium stocksii TaxID=47602 RepID=A0A9D3W4P6_9ROSI|nr:hypothetical protein J1N35_011696 [Gossypium stocksii]
MDGDAITDSSRVAKPTALFYNLLGCSLGDGGDKFKNLKFSWLKANFGPLSSNETKREKMCATQAYILQLIGGHVPNIPTKRLIIFRA